MRRVIRRLHKAGFEALLAGGCVRDILLGKTPHDYDVATSAQPDAVAELFPRTLMVGAQFGVVVVLSGGQQIEVATFRHDAVYADGRHPTKVVFSNARQDAERRDFTINGMFLDLSTDEIVDYVHGQEDLARHVVRAIGNANTRFAEDHLRMLRAIRFACQLEFDIAPDTWAAIRRHAAKISRVSRERITGELERILVNPERLRGVKLLRDSRLLKAIFPLVDSDKLNSGIKVLGYLPKCCSFSLAVAALFSSFNGSEVNGLCRDLKTSNHARKHAQWLVENHAMLLAAIPMSRGQLKKWLAEPLFEPAIQLGRASLRAAGKSETPLRRLRQQVKELGDESISPPRLLDGHELIALGAKPGPTVGQLAEELYLAQLENHITTKAQAWEWVTKWLTMHSEKTDRR